VAIDLDEWRADPELWRAAAFSETWDEQGLSEDAHQGVRAEVLSLLLRDRHDSDIDLVRFLLRQEVDMHAASWGIHESLRLAALLLNEYGRAEDVWLLWEAKDANFDTFTGLDGGLLLPAGVAGTLAYVRSAEHPDRGQVLDYLTEHLVLEPASEQDLRDRREGFRRYHLG
jgi:hypothetical protein